MDKKQNGISSILAIYFIIAKLATANSIEVYFYRKIQCPSIRFDYFELILLF